MEFRSVLFRSKTGARSSAGSTVIDPCVTSRPWSACNAGARSSGGQSNGLLSRGSEVRIPPGPPASAAPQDPTRPLFRRIALRRVYSPLPTCVCLGAALPAATRAQGWSAPGANPPQSHGADGRLEMAAAPTTSPVMVDGVLDDAVWQGAEPAGNFVQAEPD